MRKKVLSLVSLVLIGALFAGCIDFGGKTEEKEKVEYSVKDWEWYVNEEWGYKIKYPKDWEVQPISIKEQDVVLDVAFLLPKSKDTKDLVFSSKSKVEFTITVPTSSEGTLAPGRIVFIENTSDEKVPKLTGRKKTREESNLGNKSAWRDTTIYEYSLGNEKWKRKEVRIWTWIGEDILVISFSAPASEFEKWDETFEYMLKSFEFLN
jgi:hypothetical protein